jgi:hypothetical protein
MRLSAVSARNWYAVVLEEEPWEDLAMLMEKWQIRSDGSRATGAATL